MEKRKSAADIFMQQQSVPAFEETDSFADELQETLKGSLNMPSAKIEKNEPSTKVKRKQRNLNLVNIKSSEELQLEKEPIKVRITGFGIWKRVIVPPNVYVIHTRLGRKQPVTIGLGASFGFNPNKDSFMVVPAAMQTIGVVANCITKEKQGINILAYLQWQIADFAVAYKKLDFSELRDPLGIVNAQLREQAEAAIKDKIATMSVEEVLTDKAPIIAELTNRLKAVAEGNLTENNKSTDEGLGIKITTVQIREAIVCSESLWTDLQSPYRNELRKKSKISFLETENEIKQKEFETKLQIETGQTQSDLDIEMLQQKKLTEINEIKVKSDLNIETSQQKKLTEINEIKVKEESLRFAVEQLNKQKNISLEEETKILEKNSRDRLLAKENEIKFIRETENIAIETKLDEIKLAFKTKQLEQQALIKKKEAALQLEEENNKIEYEKLVAKAEIEKKMGEHQSEIKIEEEKKQLEQKYAMLQAEVDKFRLEMQNVKNTHVLFSELIKELPQIAAQMPKPDELKIIQTGGNEDNFTNSLANFLTKITAIGEALGFRLPKE